MSKDVEPDFAALPMLQQVLRWYTEQYNWEHLKGCPADDTCDCQHIAVINQFLAAGRHLSCEAIAEQGAASEKREK